MQNKISACIVLFNEEKKIRRCLGSLVGSVDEIIVVHDGRCNDRTLDIAGEYTKRIYILEHIGEAEPHRPFSFKEAKYEWILQIDADEFLSEELRDNLRKLVDNDAVASYELLWPIWNGKKQITKSWPYKRCLFRKNKISFLGIPHFVANVSGRIKRSSLKLVHQPDYYNFTWQYFKSKWVRWARIQANNYCLDFKKISKFNYIESNWPLKVRLRKKYPIILIPFEFISTLVKDLWSGGYKEFPIGYKSAFMYACYRVMVNYSIFLKKKQK